MKRLSAPLSVTCSETCQEHRQQCVQVDYHGGPCLCQQCFKRRNFRRALAAVLLLLLVVFAACFILW
jgi:hypothetical protein